MLTFTLAILFDHFQFALTHGPNIPGSYAILLFIASNFASITSHIHNWVFLVFFFCFGSIPSFFLELFFHWSPIAYWAPADLGRSSFSVLSFCLFILFMGFSRQLNTEVVYHSLLQWPTFCQTSPPWPIHLGWLHMAWPSFIELDKAVVRVVRLASFLWLWFQSICPLSAYHLTWASLTLNVGCLLTASAPDLGCGVSPLGHSCSMQLPLFLLI